MQAFDLKLQARAHWVKQKAAELGFSDCGIAQADFLEKEARFLEAW